MKGKVVGIVFCLVFALTFGGVGLWAAYTMVTTLHGAWSARDWVITRADVVAADLVLGSGRSRSARATATYRYTFEGKEYTGTRLGVTAMGGADNVGEWQEEMAEFMKSARAEKRQVNVFVNPAKPSEAVVDPKVRWAMMLFLVPFAVLFGGVGVGAFAAAWFMATRPPEGSPRALAIAQAARAKAQSPSPFSGVGLLWIFALGWNSMAFPIAALLLPQITRDGNWAGYLILLFPLVGLLLLWAAVSSTFDALRGRVPASPGATAGSTAKTAAGHHVFATDRPASFYEPDSEPRSFAPEVAIPPETAQIEEHGSRVVIRYPGGLFATLFGRVTVNAGDGQLIVEKASAFRRKEYRVPQSSVTAIAPALSYTVTSGSGMRRYYSLSATTRDGERIPLGSGIQGEEVADAVAQRIAKALKLPATHVRAASPDHKT